jgi:uroporphyrinogen-III decarboxylase
MRYSMPIRQDLPGYGLPDDSPVPQYCERQVMTVDDYDALVKNGYFATYTELMARAHPGIDFGKVFAGRTSDGDPLATRKKLDSFGLAWLMGGTAMVAADLFSMMRTFREFSLDLARVPEKVTAAAEALWQPLTDMGIADAKQCGSNVVWVGGWRTSASFLSPRLYSRFVAPTLKLAVERIVDAGLTPLLHFDANWTPMLPLLRELPAKKCILAVDHETDLYKAKEILGDRMCLLGNVSPQLLALGTVDQVVDECKHLIDVVGKGGGFILSSGCEVPYNARPENVQALIETGKSHLPGR